MTSQPGYSKSKHNQTMKFGQLIEYNTRNIFLEKSYTKCSEEAIPRPFTEKSKLSVCLCQEPEFLFSLFYCFISKLINTKIY